MNKKAYVILAVILVIIIAIVFSIKKNPSIISSISNTPTPDINGDIKGNYSIRDVMKLNLPYECSFKRTEEFSQVSGIIRMAENKVRGDFDIEIQTDKTNFGDSSPENRAFFASHFINIDGTSYIWTSLQAIGHKIPTVKSSEGGSPEEQSQIVGLDDKLDYECKPWNANLDVLKVPSGITFSELK